MLDNYTFNRKIDEPSTGGFRVVPERVRPERWGWGAVFNDGTELRQFDDATGEFHQFREIDQSKLKMLVMYKLDDPKMLKRVDIPVDPTKMQVFHKYRQFILEVGATAGRRALVYMFGWKDRETGAEMFFYILPDDRIVVSPTDVANLSEYEI